MTVEQMIFELCKFPRDAEIVVSRVSEMDGDVTFDAPSIREGKVRAAFPRWEASANDPAGVDLVQAVIIE